MIAIKSAAFALATAAKTIPPANAVPISNCFIVMSSSPYFWLDGLQAEPGIQLAGFRRPAASHSGDAPNAVCDFLRLKYSLPIWLHESWLSERDRLVAGVR